MRKIVIYFVVSISIFLVFSCNKDKTPMPVTPPSVVTCDSNVVYFEKQILPILASNCAKSGCHDAATKEEGLDYSTYQSAKESSSKLVEVISTSNANKLMPPTGNTPLTQAQIALITKWVNQGAKNEVCNLDTTNTNTNTCKTTNMSFANDISAILTSNCNGCHSGSSPSAGLDFSNYGGVNTVAASGKLYNAILQNGSAVAMPPTGKLSDCDISKIKSWVDAGHANN